MQKQSMPHLVDLPNFSDQRGCLGVVEEKGLPFPIKRIYYLFETPIDIVRGEHGHKQLQQLMICLSGACEIKIHDGRQEHTFLLSSPRIGLYVPSGVWRTLKFKHDRSVLCVLASRPYEIEDYIFSFDEFLEWRRIQQPAEETYVA